jgi:hypothetical protein
MPPSARPFFAKILPACARSGEQVYPVKSTFAATHQISAKGS